MARAIDPQSSMAALFGSRVRKLRVAAGLTQTEVGSLTHVVGSRIAQIERATGAKPTLELARAIDRALVADDLLIDLWPYVHREAFPDWSQAFIAYSARAAVIREYASHAVPGLLQTPEYARALLSVGHSLRDADHLEERVAARLDRQVRLSGPDRPQLWIILDEAVLQPADRRIRRDARPVGEAAEDGRGARRHDSGAAVQSRRARLVGRFAHRAGDAGRHRGRLHGRCAPGPVDRGTGRGRTVRSDLRSTPGDGAAAADVTRLDSIRTGGRLPCSECPVPI